MSWKPDAADQILLHGLILLFLLLAGAGVVTAQLFRKDRTRLTRSGLLLQLSMPIYIWPSLLPLSQHSPSWFKYTILGLLFAGMGGVAIVAWIQLRKLARLPHPFLDGT
jgi:hypothetical protein